MNPPSSTYRHGALFAAGLAVIAVAAAPSTSYAQGVTVATRVFLNGAPAPVYFNDGDTFRVLAGRFSGMRARLSGFNTLESYGNVHQWGSWTKKEMYNLAKLATDNARRGVWQCRTKDFAKDTYGRVLWWCKDLAVDQVRRGLAHAMTVTLSAADPDLLTAQAEAIRGRRGMWAHGVPEYVLTSLHSSAEGGGGRTYNRLVSTRDGHSAKWRHDDAYPVCKTVCAAERSVESAAVDQAVEDLRGDPTLATIVQTVSTPELRNAVADFARLGFVSGLKGSGLPKLIDKLKAFEASGLFGAQTKQTGSCGVYVPFEKRYNQGRAPCLD